MDELEHTFSPDSPHNPGDGNSQRFDPEKTMVNLRVRREHGELNVGDVVLGRYELLEKLGSGAMGMVFKCRDQVSQVEYALKMVPPELARDSDAMEDVRENFKLVHGLKHPNIASVDFLDRDEYGAYFLIMEYVPGITLSQWIREKWRNGSPELREVTGIIKQIASALDYAHQKHVLHRDIKPTNVMVTENGEVKVLDFGLASQVRSTMTAMSITPSSTSGTPSYLSPEQFKGKYPTPAADQYALGILAYQMLSGHLPFNSDDYNVLRSAVLNEEPDTIEGIPDAINQCLKKALSKNPKKRFSCCAEFADALVGTKILYSTWMRSRKVWFSLATITAVVLLAIGVLVWCTHGPSDKVVADDNNAGRSQVAGNDKKLDSEISKGEKTEVKDKAQPVTSYVPPDAVGVLYMDIGALFDSPAFGSILESSDINMDEMLEAIGFSTGDKNALLAFFIMPDGRGGMVINTNGKSEAVRKFLTEDEELGARKIKFNGAEAYEIKVENILLIVMFASEDQIQVLASDNLSAKPKLFSQVKEPPALVRSLKIDDSIVSIALDREGSIKFLDRMIKTSSKETAAVLGQIKSIEEVMGGFGAPQTFLFHLAPGKDSDSSFDLFLTAHCKDAQSRDELVGYINAFKSEDLKIETKDNDVILFFNISKDALIEAFQAGTSAAADKAHSDELLEERRIQSSVVFAKLKRATVPIDVVFFALGEDGELVFVKWVEEEKVFAVIGDSDEKEFPYVFLTSPEIAAKADNPGETVVFYEDPTEFYDGIFVVFGDGSVKFLEGDFVDHAEALEAAANTFDISDKAAAELIKKGTAIDRHLDEPDDPNNKWNQTSNSNKADKRDTPEKNSSITALHKAAEQGNTDAQNNLGYYYDQHKAGLCQK